MYSIGATCQPKVPTEKTHMHTALPLSVFQRLFPSPAKNIKFLASCVKYRKCITWVLTILNQSVCMMNSPEVEKKFPQKSLKKVSQVEVVETEINKVE